MMRWLLLLLVVGLIGCSTTSNQNNISTIPWDRPQGWEGAGALGGFHPDGSP